MKIGILTFHAAFNFGANLQAFSTFCYLKKEGHDPIIIDFFPKLLEEIYNKSVPVLQANAHKSFIEKNFILTRRCWDAEDIAKEIANYKIEGVIIGSDAVVQHYPLLARIIINPSRKTFITFRIDPIRYETNFPNPFWGEFIEYLNQKITVAMMSVSCQNTDYKLILGKEKKLIHEMIRHIDYISVRDNRTQELFSYVSNGSIYPMVAPDPVFAFNDNVMNIPSKDKILEKYNLPGKYILLSFSSSKTVSKSWISAFESITKKNGYQCVALAMPEGIKFDNNLAYKVDTPIDPMDWYSLIKYSSAYIGEKMHPIIVSLHNNVPFFSFDHYGILRFKLFYNQKTSKIYQLLERANLKDFRVSIVKKISYKPPSPDFVFDKINTFNKENCSVFANRMLNEYKTMMNELMLELKKYYQ